MDLERGDSEREPLLRSGTGSASAAFSLSTPPALAQMASRINTTAHIEVIADKQTKTVQLPETRYDNLLRKSIIKKEKARATEGEPESIEEVSLRDSTGKTYKSQSTIHVRWYLKNGAQSFGETFYVVESCGEYDAMLRRDIVPTTNTLTAAEANAFIMDRENVADRERRLAMAREREEQAQSDNVARERRVRAEYEQARGKHVRERELMIERETPAERERRVTRENARAELRQMGLSPNKYRERRVRQDYDWEREDRMREREEREKQ